jgi:quercetin dioxygenase-like cupin family protein
MRSRMLTVVVLLFSFALIATRPASAQGQGGQPIDLPCVTDSTVQPVGQAMPSDASGQALVVLRITIGPGGGFTAHTHPGTLVVVIESGQFEYTMLDDMPQTIMRGGSAATPGASEQATKGVPVMLGPGDWFVEPKGMIHAASNPGTDPTVVLITGLVDPNQPFVQCVESATPTS